MKNPTTTTLLPLIMTVPHAEEVCEHCDGAGRDCCGCLYCS